MNEATKFAREWILQYKDDTNINRELEVMTMFHEQFGTPSLEEFKATARRHLESVYTPEVMIMIYKHDITFLKQLEKEGLEFADIDWREAGTAVLSRVDTVIDNLTKIPKIGEEYDLE
jgi:hypothetical protein